MTHQRGNGATAVQTAEPEVIKRTSWDAEKQKLTEADCKQSNLEAMGYRGVITPRQVSAGLWLFESWAGYFTAGSASGLEEQAPGSIPADPLARWAKGQTGFDRKGKKRPLPPTFRPKRPAEARRAHDGWTVPRCNALQKWKEANTLLHEMSAHDRSIVTMVAIEGLTLEEVIVRITGAKAAGGRQRAIIKTALHRGLNAISDVIEPPVHEIAA